MTTESRLTLRRHIESPYQCSLELKRMEDIGMIERVDKPTEQCSPVVVVPKTNGKVRIKKAVRQENHPMPTTEQTLAKQAGAKVVTKLDTNSQFWWRKLSSKSKLLTPS